MVLLKVKSPKALPSYSRLIIFRFYKIWENNMQQKFKQLRNELDLSAIWIKYIKSNQILFTVKTEKKV